MTLANQNPKLSSLHNRIARIRQESATLKQSVEKLRAGAELLGDPFDDLNLCTYAMAPDGIIIAASPALVQLLGYESLDELRTRNADGGEYDSEYVQALFARHSGQINDIESVWRRKDGSVIYVRESARAIYDERGRPIEYDGIIEKIIGPEPIVAVMPEKAPAAQPALSSPREQASDSAAEPRPLLVLPSVIEQPVRKADSAVDDGRSTTDDLTLTAALPRVSPRERGKRGSAETKPLFALPGVVEQSWSEAAIKPEMALTSQPEPAAPRERGKRGGVETRPLFALPSVVEQPSMAEPPSMTEPSPSEATSSVDGGRPTMDDGRPATDEVTLTPQPALSVQPERKSRGDDGGEGSRRDGVSEPLDAPALLVAELLLAPPATPAQSLSAPSDGAVRLPNAPAGTGRNKLPHRVSAIQRAVERLSGQITTERPGEDRRSLLGGSMELREYWKIIQKRLWLIVLLMLLSGSVTGYYAYQQPPKYRSTTTIYLNPAAANAVMSYQYDTLASLAQTYTEFMKTRSFASQVAEKITLDTGTIIGALSTEYVANTQFYRISATYTDPQMAQSLANLAAKVLIDQNIARQQAQQEQIQAQSAPDPERDRLIEVRTSLQKELDIYNTQITAVQARLAELTDQPKSETNDKQILDYQNQLVNFQGSRLSAINGLANTQAALTTTAPASAPNLDTAVVVDAAPLPFAPLPNTTIQSILVALLAALSVGAALAFLLEYIDYTIKTPEALEAIYGTSAQGAIGLAGGKRAAERSPLQLVTLNDPHSPMAESFRVLRTGVGVAGLTTQMRSLMITSARPGEGKTFVASNLAVSLAQNGSRVILVDADLRKPSLHYVFDLQLDPGFTNLMLDQTGVIDDFLRPTSVENLRVLTCGIIPPNPAELLGSPRAAAVMEQLAKHADIVVYDSPPAATVVDAVVLGPRVDAVLHVIQAGKTRIDLVRRCKVLLERGGAHILGAVLNQVSLPELRAYSYYYSYNYKQSGGKRPKRPKGPPSKTKISSNGATVRSK